MPPFDYDLGDAGKKVSDGFVFFTSYNTERATGKLEVTSTQRDRDYIAMVDWRMAEKAAAEGKGALIGGVKVLNPKELPGLVYLLPCGKSPHGVDVAPDGNWIVGSGKLQGVTTVFNFEKIQTAIKNKDFTGDEDGIPVLKYESIKDAEVPVGLGPLHTQFGPDGYAYTSLFVDSAIAKWKLGTWEVVDKIPMSYSIGHLTAAEGDTVEPGRQLPGRPEQAVARPAPLGRPVPARVLAAGGHHRREDEAALRRLHRARAALRADGEGRQAQADRGVSEGREHAPARRSGTSRTPASRATGNKVLVKMVAVRSTLTPTDFEVKDGDEVTIAITNIEQTTDELHGLGILDYNINIVVDPGETKTVTFKAKRGRVPLLLHELLLGAPPGDAGLHDRPLGHHRRAPRLRGARVNRPRDGWRADAVGGAGFRENVPCRASSHA